MIRSLCTITYCIEWGQPDHGLSLEPESIDTLRTIWQMMNGSSVHVDMLPPMVDSVMVLLEAEATRRYILAREPAIALPTISFVMSIKRITVLKDPLILTGVIARLALVLGVGPNNASQQLHTEVVTCG